MKTRVLLAASLAIALSAWTTQLRADDAKIPQPPSSQKIPAPPGWKLVWNDEFDAPAIDRSKWGFDLGNDLVISPQQAIPGWGNGELEFYTDRAENAFVREGMLHLEAIKESYKGHNYTSARLKTRGKFSKACGACGRFEIRAKLPTGKGIWPAIWLLPEEEKYGPWPASGEIDLMEARGQKPDQVVGTLHFGSHWPKNVHAGKDFTLPDHGTIADFHIYALEWEPGEIRWYVDDRLYQTQNFWWSCPKTNGGNGVSPAKEADLNPWPAPFDQKFFIILNVAVGGEFPGKPDQTTKFPAEMVVDYVRVYDKVAGYGPAKPRGEGNVPFERK